MEYFDKLSDEQREMIEKHLLLVTEKNKQTNLTRITNWEEALVLHVEDSLSALEEVNESPQGLMGDLGSGAGYPGIPLSIATGRKTVLIDSRLKKMNLVEEMIEELQLGEQISTFAGRAELLARKEGDKFAVLTARALAKLPVLMELASPLLKRGGYLVCYKAKIEKEELNQALSLQKITGMKFISRRDFELQGEYERSIVTFKKVSKASVSLPRKEGEAQKKPLVP